MTATPPTPPAPQTPSATRRDTGRRSWHRRASRPVTLWLVAWLIALVAQPFIPQARWLLVHMITLGLVTNSIFVWGQHFTEALLRVRVEPATRKIQVARIQLLNLGIVFACVGMVLAWPIFVVGGATIVGAAAAWYAIDLALALRRSLGSRFAVVVQFYVVAAALLPFGAGFGGWLAFAPREPWAWRVLVAHQAVNVLGFVGLTVLGTVATLWPTVLRRPMPTHQVRGTKRVLYAALAAVVLACGGALLGRPTLVAGALALYVCALLQAGFFMVSAARTRAPADFPSLSIAAGFCWWIGTLVAMALDLVRHGAETGAHWHVFTVPLVAGVLAQIVLGAMSYLMPTVMGGGPKRVRASLATLSRLAAFRVGVTNAGLLVAVVVGGRAGTIALAAALISLAAVLPLLTAMIVGFVRGARAARAAQASGEAAPVASGQAVAGREAITLDKRFTHDAGLAGAHPSRRTLLGLGLGAGTVAALAVGARVWPTSTTATGTVQVTVTARDMRFSPDHVSVPQGNRLVVTLVNDDDMEHNLTLDDGRHSDLVAPGSRTTFDAGVITGSHEAWCSVIGHKQMGMVFHIDAGAPVATPSSAAAAVGPVFVDLTRPPGSGYQIRDAALPPAPATDLRFTLTAGDGLQEIAPGRTLDAMTYDGRVMGPVLVGRLGQHVLCHLENQGSMGHSVDFHAGQVSPDQTMRTIPPGQSLDYPFTLNHSGIWLYHCSSMPMSMHIASGMFGPVIVPPTGAAAVDREYVLVQSEAYLGANGAGSDADKIAAETPDLYLFNGHANQYAFAPLTAKVGERVRFWVLAAGPAKGISFHVVGAQFDTVFKEGAYVLRPDNAEGGAAQSLDLGVAQGGFVEAVFAEPGTYTFVNHDMAAAEHGARGKIVVS